MSLGKKYTYIIVIFESTQYGMSNLLLVRKNGVSQLCEIFIVANKW